MEGKFGENFCELRVDGLGIGDCGLGIVDWGLGIGLMQITPNLPSFFHFIQKLLIFF